MMEPSTTHSTDSSGAPAPSPPVPQVTDAAPTSGVAANTTSIPPKPQYLFPPFPTSPINTNTNTNTEAPRAKILTFSEFREHGIQIFADPETGIELDGLGIPTVRLRVPHDTDVRKTTARVVKGGGTQGEGEEGEGEGEEEGEGNGAHESYTSKKKRKKKKKKTVNADGTVTITSKPNRNQKNVKLPVDLSTIKDPVERALEQKRQRLMLFAQQEWWEQWAEGEDLRRGRTYDSSLTPIDRIHMAATDFRTGRIWPPASTNVRYLWDQFRLYTGLLGSPPVWKRTDIPNYGNSDSDDNDDEADDSDAFLNPNPSARAKQNTARRAPSDSSDDEILHTKYSDEEDELDMQEEDEGGAGGENNSKSKPSTSSNQKKRIPPRAPYALFHTPPPPPGSSNLNSNSDNKDVTSSKTHPSQILISHPSQIPVLLSLSSTLRQTRLLNFLADPAGIVAEFLSSYLYAQGLVWGSPARMIGIGRLVLFWLEFMKRCGVLSDSNSSGSGSREGRYRDRGAERELSKAIAVAQKAVGEIPRAGWVVRMCPEELMGRGCRALWGTRWREEGDVDFDFNLTFEGIGLGVNGTSEVKQEDAAEEDEEEDVAARLKRFEDELRAENVQLFSADPVELGVPPLHREEGDEEDEPIVIETKTGVSEPTVMNSLAATTSIGTVDDDGSLNDPTTATENTARVINGDNIPDHDDLPPPILPSPDDVTRSPPTTRLPPPVDWSLPSAPFIAPGSATESTSTSAYTQQQKQQQQQQQQNARTTARNQAAALAAWLPPREQLLFNILGSVSSFPLLYTAGGRNARVGCVERSVRRVKGVYGPGVGGVFGEDTDKEKPRKPTAMEESLVGAFVRVVLEPWVDWDDVGVAVEYRVPSVCGPRDISLVEEDVRKEKEAQGESKKNGTEENGQDEEERESESQIRHHLRRITQDRARYAHNAGVDDITILVEPRVAEGLSVGMGLLGTWVQIVPVPPPSSPFFSSGSGSGSRGRGRGRGGRGGSSRGGRGGGQGGDSTADQTPKKERTFWYIEDMHMAIPSFWAVPKKDVPGSLMAEGEELGRMFYEAIEEGDVVGDEVVDGMVDEMDEFMG